MAAYCSVTDLTDVFPSINDYQSKTVVDGFTLTSGQTNTYYKGATGQVNAAFQNDLQLTKQTSIANTESNAGSWYYDSDEDALYVHPSGSDDPNDYTIEIGEDWDAFFIILRAKAQQLIDGYLSGRYQTPLMPRMRKTHDTSDYDYIVVRVTAICICWLLVNRLAPGNEQAAMLYKEFYNPNPEVGEVKGLINQLVDGDIYLQDQISPGEAGGFNIYPGSSNDNDELYVLPLGGKYKGYLPQTWKIEITTGGTPGTAIFRLSYDGGTAWDLTNQQTRDTNSTSPYVSLGNGLWGYFDPSTTYTTNDEWEIELYPNNPDITTGAKFASVLTGR